MRTTPAKEILWVELRMTQGENFLYNIAPQLYPQQQGARSCAQKP